MITTTKLKIHKNKQLSKAIKMEQNDRNYTQHLTHTLVVTTVRLNPHPVSHNCLTYPAPW